MVATIAGHQIAVSRDDVERTALGLEPEPIDVWHVVVGGRRYPPKQVVEAVTRIDRADFNSHQARALLTRLGFVVARRASTPSNGPTALSQADPSHTVLDEYAGRWIAQRGEEVLFDASSPEAVVQWLQRHRRRATVWRVPATAAEAGSASSVSA